MKQINGRTEHLNICSITDRELISVDDDYMAEHEAKILKEADMQEKILQAVEKIRLQIKQLKQAQEGAQAEVIYVMSLNYANFNPLMRHC